MSTEPALRQRLGKTKNSELKNRNFETEDESESEVDEKPKPKEPVTLNKVLVRTSTALVMLFSYLGMLRMGHFYCLLFVVLCQTEIYREVINVRYDEAREKKIPLFRSLQWAFFFVAMLWAYGEAFHKFCSNHKGLSHIAAVTQHYDQIAFPLYIVLFIVSVLFFKKGMIRFQISQYMWSIVTICLVVFQCKYFAMNILNGLFWFWFPMATVVINDVSAYFCGITMGRKFITSPFFQMSPNKTWEGFLGAAVLTLIFSFFFPALLAPYSWFVCPAESLHVWPLPPSELSCNVHPIFLPTSYPLPASLNTFLSSLIQLYPTLLSSSSSSSSSSTTLYSLVSNSISSSPLSSSSSSSLYSLTLLPIQLHGLSYGLFASLVAPFGGFFASAMKRAYRIKDFDSFFPGHGGMMDRMDCQLMMLGFTSFHYAFYVASRIPSVTKLLSLVSLLPTQERSELIRELVAQYGYGQ